MKFIALIILQLSAIQNSLLQDLMSFQQTKNIKHGIVAAHIQRVNDGKTILALNEQKAVNSASTLKLITTATAIDKLGSDYRFQTDLGYSGTITNGTLHGSLIINPGGDPSLGSERSGKDYGQILNECLRAIRAVGIQKVNENVIIRDLSEFSYDVPDSWIWGDLGNYYGAIPHRFNINENKFSVYFQPGYRVGEAASINILDPVSSTWKIINQVKTGKSGSGDQVYIYSSPSTETILMKGTIPLGKNNFEVKGSIPNPAGLFRELLIDRLENEGIEVVQAQLQPTIEEISQSRDFHLLHRFNSESLYQLAQDCNYNSINIYADAFLHQLQPGEFASFEKGVEQMTDHWLAKGLSLGGFNPKDGSGLSPSGMITTENMTDILRAVALAPSGSHFIETIPVLGESGSVRYKDRNKVTGGRISVKSGYISGTRAYAGYLTDKQGELYSFMVCVNHYEPNASSEVRRFLDDFLIKMGSK
ncbi:D-alanyl-D-alanine carboxypeptidase/D-alanyl-D-alanine endopeptidase [Jiulongibacter sp. NS-SX5]|uniref:D-alanyl-D-alanine carboxypeptidase/D-alanyl-D-alanine endopeptidase n=1 Tax=Jiulongibacter sp. NS-SX5 TaxID=3463854 RepID=UPI004058E585